MSLRLQNGSLKDVFAFVFSFLSILFCCPTARATAADPEGNYKYFTATVVWNSESEAQNVPVLLRFSEATISGFDRGDVTESGLEIVDENGNLLPWEIDTWNATGEILVWVLLPNYHNGAKFTVRYGTDFANACPPASDVWAGYVGVWHLNDLDVDASTYGSYSNSTAIAGLDGEKAQASIAGEEGVIGKSVKICDAEKQGTGYQLGGVFVNDSGTDSPLDLGNTFAISGWFKHKNQDYHYDKFFAKRKKANNKETPNNAFAIEVGNSGGTHNVTACGSSSANTKVTFSSTLKGVWKRIMFVYDNKSCRVYENGVLRGTSSIAAVTDNDAKLCFGNMTTGYGSGTGDCAWCGWIDEVRLADGVPTADWIAAEYNAMASASALELSAASTTDTTAPSLSVPSLLRNADGSFTVSVEVAENTPDSIFCSIGGDNYPMTTAGLSLPAIYSVTVSSLPAGTYTAAVRATGTGGTTVTMYCTDAFHAGALIVSAVSDADEGTMTPGVFRVARADTDATGLPALTFDVAFSGDGLAAVVAPTVSTLTIPADAAYVDIPLTPVYTTAVDANKTITVSVSGAFVGQSSDATLTVVNADYDISVRYVATNGNDADHGGTSDLPKATIGAAVSSLVNVAKSQPCVVYVAPGEYPQTEAIRVEAPIKILGTGESATNVVLKNTTSGQRVITIAHADAELALVTLTGGSATTDAACLGIEAGLVRDCWVTGCTYYVAREKTGGTVFMSGGRLMRSVIEGNTIPGTSWNEEYSAGVYATAGIVENCLIKGNKVTVYNNTSRVEASALNIVGTAQAVNCTVVGNTAKWKDDTRVPMTTYCGANAKIVNCVIFGNACDNPNYTVWAGTAANYINCASEVAINGTCPAIIDPAFADPDNGDYTPVYTSPLRDAGSNSDYTAAATSATDIKGDTRILHDTIDIGAWENVPVAGLAVDFSYTVNRRLLPASVTFTAMPENASGEVAYKWDFDSDGTVDRETTDTTITAELTVAKVYDVTLTAISGQETATAIKYQAFSAIQKDIYVATNGTAAYPFATPATASTTIHAAVDASDDGCVIHVLPGTYSQSVPFALDKAVTLVSATTNAADVILRNTASDQRIVEVSDEGAELVGVTLTNGKGSPRGAALTMTAGLVRDCTITGNSTGGAKGDTSGTVWMSDGRLMRCRIVANSGGTGWNADCGGGVNAIGGIVDSCLVATNRVSYWGDIYTTALGVKLSGTAKAINCTIANNVCTNPGVDSEGHGAYPMATDVSANAQFVNCVIWGNVTEPEDTQNFVWHGTAASYIKCYSELTINETSPAITDPGFTDVAIKDYSLTATSPLINKGTDYAAAGGISEFDIVGKPRLIGSKVDIGCYESPSRCLVIIVR